MRAYMRERACLRVYVRVSVCVCVCVCVCARTTVKEYSNRAKHALISELEDKTG